MATAKESAKQPSEALDNKAVKNEVKDAANDASTGNVATVKETTNQPSEDLPTNARSHPAE